MFGKSIFDSLFKSGNVTSSGGSSTSWTKGIISGDDPIENLKKDAKFWGEVIEAIVDTPNSGPKKQSKNYSMQQLIGQRQIHHLLFRQRKANI